MSSGREHGWRAGDGVVVRTPLLPASWLAAWQAAPDPRRVLAELVAEPAIDEAIFVASPSLHSSIAAWRERPDSEAGRRTEHALVKYVARMAGRSTPFGLFSGVSTGALARETRLELAPRAEYRRRTRLDNDYLFVLAEELARSPDARERLVVRPNTSLYRLAGRLRYAAPHVKGKDRTYHLVSVEPTPYLDATLERARAGATIAELAEPLVGDDITLEEARAYVEELIAAGMLVPELGVHITGPEPIDGMIAQLRAAELATPADVLASARAAIGELDGAGLGNAPDRYRAIAAGLEALPAKIELARLFQVDMVKPAGIAIGRRIAADVLAAVSQLARISPPREAKSLGELRRAFRDRFEDREVPLADVLDEESGLGFEAARVPGAEGSPLLAGIAFPAGKPERQIGWGPSEAHLLRRLGHAVAGGHDEIVLADADLEAMKADTPARLPAAFATFVRLASTADELARGEPTILLEHASGPSGANLLGRFCHASPAIDQLVRAHLAAEEALAPDAIFAEIVHLNEGRIGNVVCRPVLRAYEIPFLGISGAPRDRQILIDDLVVSVRGDRLVLRSRRLGREVIPRLTTAHNYRLRTQGVYRFLCALASQHVDLVGWSWGPLADAPYLPRVRWGRIVFQRAIWNLAEPELEPITAAVRSRAPARVLAAVQALRDARRLPRWLVISAGDNELPIDLDNPLLAAAFADELSGAKRVKLEEMFPAPDRLPVSGPEGRFANEVILTFTRSQPAEAPAAVSAPMPAPTVARRFVPGSEWLFAKIYGGESATDRVLRDVIAPVVREVHGGRWFFLRYSDPEPHVRVRFRGDPAHLTSAVLPALERALAPLLEEGVARKLVLDTYEREIERYGGDRGIELVEDVFWRDSEAVLGIVELLDGDAGADARWRLAVRGLDSLLEMLGLTAEQRARVFADGRDALGREMNADTAFWGRIGDRFAKERASLEVLFARDPARDAGHDLEPGFELLAQRDAALAEVCAELRRRDAAGELAPGLAGMAWSLAHMHANRLLHASQRAQELVLYDFLRRLHAARRARGAS